MQYLHTMLRVADLDRTLDFFCNKLGFVEISRQDHPQGRFGHHRRQVVKLLVFQADVDAADLEVEAALLTAVHGDVARFGQQFVGVFVFQRVGHRVSRF